MPDIKLIVAIDDNRGIGKAGKLAWDLPSDRKYFRDHVHAGPLVMGWNTFAENKCRPYGSGKNYIITHRDADINGVTIIHDANHFFESIKEDIWVAGGSQVYTLALPFATTLYITRVCGDFSCDTFFPPFEAQFDLFHEEATQIENGMQYKNQIWKRKNLVVR